MNAACPTVRCCSQGHLFCTECLAPYFAARTCTGDVLAMRCPEREVNKIGGACPGIFPHAVVEAILNSSEVGIKYRRLRMMKQNEDNRECPRCGKVELGSPMSPDMTCGACTFQYCFHHADAHSGVQCARYGARREGRVVSARSRVWKWMRTKRCPHCNVYIEKNGGCPHMTCASCKKGFCWFCLSTDASMHSRFQPVWHREAPALAIVFGATLALVLTAIALVFCPAYVLGLAVCLPVAALLVYVLLLPVYALVVAFRNERRDRKMRQQNVTPTVWQPQAGECGHAFSSDSPFNCVFCNFSYTPQCEAGAS